jgi:CMP-N-acetylneuraminic acid synthetase
MIDRTIVSTEDEEIANISLKCGSEVPFLRPKILSGDNVPDFPVIYHAIEHLNSIENYVFDIIVYLRPTMPIRSSKEIDDVIRKLIDTKNVDCVRTTRKVTYSPYWMKKINTKGLIEPYHEHVVSNSMKRRQDLPKVYMCDGYVDAARVESIMKEDKFPPKRQLAFNREKIPFIDIDTFDDWAYCEYLFKKLT